MRAKRTITTTVVCLMSLSAAMPSAAAASSLLSGYGGPGQGNQAILGSALLNVPNNGGGSGSGGSPGGRSRAGESSNSGASAAAPRSGAAPGSGVAGAGRVNETSAAFHAGAHALARARRGSHATGEIGVASVAAQAGAAGYHPTQTRPASVGSEPLGLRGAYFLYILLGLVALALIAVLTKRMTRTAAAGRDS